MLPNWGLYYGQLHMSLVNKLHETTIKIIISCIGQDIFINLHIMNPLLEECHNCNEYYHEFRQRTLIYIIKHKRFTLV